MYLDITYDKTGSHCMHFRALHKNTLYILQLLVNKSDMRDAVIHKILKNCTSMQNASSW